MRVKVTAFAKEGEGGNVPLRTTLDGGLRVVVVNEKDNVP